MVNLKNILIATVIAAAAVVAFLVFFQSDEAKIKKKFHLLAETAHKNGSEHDLIAAKKAHQIEQMFFGTVRIRIPSYSVDKTFPRGEISPHVLYARARYQNISLKFHDFQLTFPAENKAVVGLTGILKAVAASGEPVHEIHEAECTLKKIDNDWLFTGIKEVEVLER